jgi:hypothetical protein
MSGDEAAHHWLRPDREEAPALSLPAALAAVDLGRGVWAAKWPAAPITLSFDKGSTPPPHWLGERVPVVSERLLRTLAGAGVDNFQTFPVRVIATPGGVECPGYLAFNLVGCVDAADSEASVGEILIDDEPGPRLVAYSKLVLARARAHDLDLFRLADSPSTIIAHDRVVRALRAHAPSEGWGLSAIELPAR